MQYYFLRFPEGKTKAVTFSYDDGCRQDLRLCEVFNKYGMKATFNLNSNRIGIDEWHLSEDEIREKILGSGHEVAVHCANHKQPGMTILADGIREVIDCRVELEKMFGGIIKGMAYPNSGIRIFENGATYNDVKSYLTQLGIAYARSLGSDNDSFHIPQDWHNWIPTAHHNNPKLFEWIERFVNTDVKSLYTGARRPMLCYIWGHSYEFDNNNNWDRIEEICQKLSCKDDTWYATNIEICNYIKAYHSLEFNMDMSLCYNPTAYTVWFEADGKDYCIKSGETIEIH